MSLSVSIVFRGNCCSPQPLKSSQEVFPADIGGNGLSWRRLSLRERLSLCFFEMGGDRNFAFAPQELPHTRFSRVAAGLLFTGSFQAMIRSLSVTHGQHFIAMTLYCKLPRPGPQYNSLEWLHMRHVAVPLAWKQTTWRSLAGAGREVPCHPA